MIVPHLIEGKHLPMHVGWRYCSGPIRSKIHVHLLWIVSTVNLDQHVGKMLSFESPSYSKGAHSPPYQLLRVLIG